VPSPEPPAIPAPRTTADHLAEITAAAARRDDAAIASAVGQIAATSSDLATWIRAAGLLTGADPRQWARRRLRVAVLASHTSGHLTAVLPVAMARHGIAVETYEAPYGQYEQEILDPGSGLYTFGPDLVLLLIDERDVRFPSVSPAPRADLSMETERWRSLWSLLRERTGAVLVQSTFVPRNDDVLGHLALSTAGSRRRQLRALNLELGDNLPTGVHLLDAELLAASVGSSRWSDDRYWFLAKQAIGLGAVTALSRELARITAAAVGLTRKVIAVDLDNTLWGGVIGEDGLAGIVLGNGSRGEAFQAFQDHLLALRERGVLLAVVSKNNDADAREPFLHHPDMRLALSDFVAFRASWDDKSSALRQLAEDLSLGLDAFVFIDDNPFERDAVRRTLPDVDVVDLPEDVTGYPATLARHPSLEPGVLTAEDTSRTSQYQALAKTAESRKATSTPEEFLAGLKMHATFAAVGEASLPRVVQLLGKTNQFNLTGRRHSEPAVRELIDRDGAVHLTLRMQDRFSDHGLVGVLLAVPEGRDLRVDTWLMSCRVLGRGVEIATMSVLTKIARSHGYARVIGEFVASGRNQPARDVYERCGFSARTTDDARSMWSFDLDRDTVPDPGHITTQILTEPNRKALSCRPAPSRSACRSSSATSSTSPPSSSRTT
jgi:FkbH-like protein